MLSGILTQRGRLVYKQIDRHLQSIAPYPLDRPLTLLPDYYRIGRGTQDRIRFLLLLIRVQCRESFRLQKRYSDAFANWKRPLNLAASWAVLELDVIATTDP